MTKVRAARPIADRVDRRIVAIAVAPIVGHADRRIAAIAVARTAADTRDYYTALIRFNI
jgi:hypothetical protein